ncbi:MAG TPA: RDD family protein [Terriglobales bacterium]|nr:RDD family protein [Terriglobales bacterium]
MRHRADPQQAGFFRRFLAFAADTLIMTFLAIFVFFAGNEAAARLRGRTGELTRFLRAIGEGSSVSVAVKGTSLGLTVGNAKSEEADFKRAFLQKLRATLPDDEFAAAVEMDLGRLEKAYPKVMDGFPPGSNKVYVLGGEGLSLVYEFICGYAYFILFFRFGGRTPGKRLFGLKVVSLDGRPRLGWYEAFERTHGYAASALAASIGFLQVLWDREGLTMHDRIAGTTVIRQKKPAPPRPAPKESAVSREENDPEKDSSQP